MLEEIKRVVETTYIQNDYEHFISGCHEKIEFIGELLDAARTRCEKADFWEPPGDTCTEVHFDVCGVLAAKGFKRLSYAERDEVIPEVEMPRNKLFGSQMTVEYAVFKDIWSLCKTEEKT